MDRTGAAGVAGPVTRQVARWVAGLSSKKELSLTALRAAFSRYPLSFRPREQVRSSPLENAAVRGRWFIPRGCDTRRRLVYVHSGGFVCGDWRLQLPPSYLSLVPRFFWRELPEAGAGPANASRFPAGAG